MTTRSDIPALAASGALARSWRIACSSLFQEAVGPGELVDPAHGAVPAQVHDIWYSATFALVAPWSGK